jgi:hypothetical protein
LTTTTAITTTAITTTAITTTSTSTTLYPPPTLDTRRSLPLHDPTAPPAPPCSWSSPVIPGPEAHSRCSQQASKQARPTDRPTATARQRLPSFLPPAPPRLFRTVVVFSTMVLAALCE